LFHPVFYELGRILLPRVFAMLEPLARNRLKAVLSPSRYKTLRLPFNFPWVLSQRERLSGLRTPVPGVRQSDFGINTKCQKLLLSTELILKPPVFAARGINKQEHAFAIRDFVRFCLGLSVANLRVRKGHWGITPKGGVSTKNCTPKLGRMSTNPTGQPIRRCARRLALSLGYKGKNGRLRPSSWRPLREPHS